MVGVFGVFSQLVKIIIKNSTDNLVAGKNTPPILYIKLKNKLFTIYNPFHE
ncbi:hypothetical protein GCM10027155_12310 [Acinetobacter apis]